METCPTKLNLIIHEISEYQLRLDAIGDLQDMAGVTLAQVTRHRCLYIMTLVLVPIQPLPLPV